MNLFKIITNINFYEKNPILYFYDRNDNPYFRETGNLGVSPFGKSHEPKWILLSSNLVRQQFSSKYTNEINQEILSSQINTLFHEIGHAVLTTTTITNSDVETLNKTRNKFLVKNHYTNMTDRYAGGKKIGYQKSYEFVDEIESLEKDSIFDSKKYIQDNKLEIKVDKKWNLPQIKDEIINRISFEVSVINKLYDISWIYSWYLKDTMIFYVNNPKLTLSRDKESVQLLKGHKLDKLYIGTFNKYMNSQIEISLNYVDNLNQINSNSPDTIFLQIIKAPGVDFIEEIKKKLNENEMFKNKQFRIWKGYYKENVLLTNDLVSELINSSNNKLSLDIRMMDDDSDGSAIFEVKFIEDYLNYDNWIADKDLGLDTKIIIFIVAVISVSVLIGLIVMTVMIVKSKNRRNRS